jgi:glycosyltransferase involved in cell wall biosynthesis
LRQLCRELGVTHIFEVAVFREPFPRFGLPTVGIVHDLDYPDRGSSPLDRIFREWLDSAAWLFTNSSQTRAELLELAPEAAERVEVMLHPPAAPPSPLLRREDSPWRRPEPVLYYPASAIPRKGHDVLLSALSALAARGVPFHCYLSGRGTETLWSEQTSDDEKAEAVRRACQPWRHSLRDRVTPLGAREWAEVEQLYAAADLVVLPTRYEGYGLPLGEALRRERPVVASQLPSFEEQINFLDAAPLVRLTPPGDATALADTLVEALGGAQPFPEFSPELRSRLAVWTWEAFADRVVAALAAAGAPAA